MRIRILMRVYLRRHGTYTALQSMEVLTMALVTPTHVTPADVLDYLLTLTPTEETLVYGGGRGRFGRLGFLLGYNTAGFAPLSLYHCPNAWRPCVLYESVDIAPPYRLHS